jgi:D-sedoheptulose 7-phosphate isomerase
MTTTRSTPAFVRPPDRAALLCDGYLEELRACLDQIDRESVLAVAHILEDAYRFGARVFIAGNGGSATTAAHIATDLAKSVRNDSDAHGFRAISLADNVGVMTAWANDEGFDTVFSEALRTLAAPRDVLVIISGSGASANVIAAARTAREMGVRVIGLLGRDGGRVLALTDAAVIAPSDDYGVIEDTHLAIGHLLTRHFRRLILDGDLTRD